MSLATIPIIAYTVLFFTPITSQSLSHLSFTPQHFILSYPAISVISAILGSLAFSQFPTFNDICVATLLYIGRLSNGTPSASLLSYTLKACIQRVSTLFQGHLVHQLRG